MSHGLPNQINYRQIIEQIELDLAVHHQMTVSTNPINLTSLQEAIEAPYFPSYTKFSLLKQLLLRLLRIITRRQDHINREMFEALKELDSHVRELKKSLDRYMYQ
jgi:hypothetical protein